VLRRRAGVRPSLVAVSAVRSPSSSLDAGGLARHGWLLQPRRARRMGAAANSPIAEWSPSSTAPGPPPRRLRLPRVDPEGMPVLGAVTGLVTSPRRAEVGERHRRNAERELGPTGEAEQVMILADGQTPVRPGPEACIGPLPADPMAGRAGTLRWVVQGFRLRPRACRPATSSPASSGPAHGTSREQGRRSVDVHRMLLLLDQRGAGGPATPRESPQRRIGVPPPWVIATRAHARCRRHATGSPPRVSPSRWTGSCVPCPRPGAVVPRCGRWAGPARPGEAPRVPGR